MAARRFLRPLASLSSKLPLLSSSSTSLSRRPISGFSSPNSGPGSPVRHFSDEPRFDPQRGTPVPEGCDYQHWFVVMDDPPFQYTREEIIDAYVRTLAVVVGSEEVAREKIYSVSTKCYFAFGALLSEELAYKLRDVTSVRWVLPDSYVDAKNQDYGGEPFIDGKAVPYEPNDFRYHAAWVKRMYERKKLYHYHENLQKKQEEQEKKQHPGQNNHHHHQQNSSSSDRFGPGPNQFENNTSSQKTKGNFSKN